MDEIPLISEFFVIFAFSIVVILLCFRMKIPAVVGLLLTGVISGPYGFGVVHKVEDVQTMANIGIILLLFTVGMEVSLKKIWEIKRLFFAGGALQTVFTIVAGFLLGKLFGGSSGASIFLGCLLALSSTAVVLRMLVQKGESDTPHGRSTIAILIFQDFCAVPMMLIIPFLAGENLELNGALFLSAIKGIAIIAIVFIAACLVVPRFLYHVARTRIRELFLFTLISICLGVAWVSQLAGLSLSLGAFLAGLIISQSDFSNEAISDIAPFQDLFTSLFFISIGMLLNVGYVIAHPVLILSLALIVILIKAVAATFAGMGAGLPVRTAAWMGLSLAQISEFSFVLAKSGADHGLASPEYYQLFLAVAIVTIALTPWMISLGHKWAALWDILPVPTRYKYGYKAPTPVPSEELKNHVVIIGFGVSGRALAHSCKEASIPYAILEMNSQTVRKERSRGEPIHFGDASHHTVLEHVFISSARLAALVINDASAAVRIVKRIKEMNPLVHLIVRTRYVQDVKFLYSLGADDVIADEHGAAVEVFTRVLMKFSIPKEKMDQVVMSALAGIG